MGRPPKKVLFSDDTTKMVKNLTNEVIKNSTKENESYTKYSDEELEDYATEVNRTLVIDFKSLLDRDLGEYNSVTYNFKRRAFYGFTDFICYNLNYILNKMPLLGIIYLDFHTKIFGEEEYTFEMFCNDIEENMVNNDELREIINDIIESTYSINLDEDSKSIKKNIIEDLQVTDATNKSILKAAIMIRLLIPIISEFEDRFGYSHNTYIYNTIFTQIIRDFSEPGTNSLVKLNKMIDSRVEGTEYSDKVIWSYLKKLGLDPYTVKCEIKNSIIFSIIAKLQVNTSIVSFLDVVVKHKIAFKFTYNYPVSYKTFRIEQTDDDLDENERVDIMLKQSSENEGKNLIHKIAIRRYIKNNIIEKYDITEKDINNFKELIGSLNDIHIKLLEVYYSKKFRLIVKDNNLYYLLIGMIYDLEEKGYEILPQILTSKIDYSTKISYSNRSLNKTIIQSKDYIELLENYKFALDLIGKDDFILKLCSISSYKFVKKDEKGNEETLKIDKNALSIEVINFAKMI